MLDEEAVRKMVRRVVHRTLGLPQGSSPVAARPLITEADVRDLPIGAELSIPQGALVTPHLTFTREDALQRKPYRERIAEIMLSQHALAPQAESKV